MTSIPQIEPTRPAKLWAASAVLLIGIGWFKGINLMLLLGDFLLALLFLNVLLARRSVAGIQAERRERGPVFAGEIVLVSVTVSDPTRLSGNVSIRDTAVTPSTSWLLAPSVPETPMVIRGEQCFPTRGHVELPPLQVESGYPFGLIRWKRSVGSRPWQVVLPAAGSIRIEQLRHYVLRSSSGEGRSRRPARRYAPGLGDLRGVRPYRIGDSPRDIHWRSTARRNQLIVREYDQTDPLHLILILDPWQPENASDSQRQTVEWALEMAASVALAWVRADEPGDFSLVIPGVDAAPPARWTETGLRSLLAPLAKISGQPVVAMPEISGLRPQAHRTARLVVSSRPDSPILAAIRSRGMPSAGVDPSLELSWYLPPHLGPYAE